MTEQRTILIVDDSEDEIRLTERVLSKIAPDMEMVSAASGEEALALLKGLRPLPVLTLLDLKMTGIDGVETLRRIRADEALKNLQVAIVTNSNLESDRNEAMDAGAEVFIQKAYDMDRFTSDIQALLERLARD